MSSHDDRASSPPADPAAAAPRRRRRTRQQTEADLLAAARRLLGRDGVLGGLNLREVAAEAGVNHGQIYQYYGNRRALLRAAIAETTAAHYPEIPGHWQHGFAERRRRMFRWGLGQIELAKFQALLALDGDEQLSLLPELALTRQALERDRARGDLPAGADGLAAHVMTVATSMGYRLFREVYARDAGIDVQELDERAARAFEQMLSGLTGLPADPDGVVRAAMDGQP